MSFAITPPSPAAAQLGVRPALSDPMHLDQEAIVKAGFPPRPDPNSPFFKTWLSIVAKPATLIPNHAIARPDLHMGPVTSQNTTAHTGLQQHISGDRYGYVAASFTVPGFNPFQASADASVWPGIQGNGELIQDGIYFRRVSQVGTFTTWWEFFPNAVVFSSLTISPGDSVVFAAWEGDSACNFGLRFGTGCFYFQNVTKGTVSGIQIVPDPFPGTFTADSCEGIVERHPPLNLAQWVFAPLQMETDCYDTFGNYENFSLMPYTNITMVNGSNAIMATTTSVSSSLMSFNWVRGN